MRNRENKKIEPPHKHRGSSKELLLGLLSRYSNFALTDDAKRDLRIPTWFPQAFVAVISF